MTIPAQRRTLKAKYDSAPKELRDYLSHLPKLLEDFPLDVSISYVFSKVELAHNMSLYCGVIKIHKTNHEVTRAAIEKHHMTREGFLEQFTTVFSTPIPNEIAEPLERAEEIRDKIMHGKHTTERDKREAINKVLDYAESFNELVHGIAKLKPFGSLQGFKGRAKSLDKSSSRWILKGMGFTLS